MGDRFDPSFTSDLMSLDSCQFHSWLAKGTPKTNKNIEISTSTFNYHSLPSHPIPQHYQSQNAELLPTISSNSLHENRMPHCSYSLNLTSSNRSHSSTSSQCLIDASSEVHQHNPSYPSLSSGSKEYHHQPSLRPRSSHNLNINAHVKPDPLNSMSIPSSIHTSTTASIHNTLNHGHNLRILSPNLNSVLVSNPQPLVHQPTDLISNQALLPTAQEDDTANMNSTSDSQQVGPRRRFSDLRSILPDGPTVNGEKDSETCSDPQKKQNPWYLRRIYHRTAEQQRRDVFKECLKELRDIIPGTSQKRANKLVLLRQVVEHVKSLQTELYERDKEIERLRIMLQESGKI